ncbi:Odorant receptor [Temnothorax longispinosus]|uniref:Odorant receptor n=1 Tax=Temnothorax longispinosus TaxID=300112 RepID=A0A4S2KE45_9HYME|nr:Odorant receptor [Temnothorax longispinosus]
MKELETVTKLAHLNNERSAHAARAYPGVYAKIRERNGVEAPERQRMRLSTTGWREKAEERRKSHRLLANSIGDTHRGSRGPMTRDFRAANRHNFTAIRSPSRFESFVIRVNIALLRLSGVVSYENGSIRRSSSQNILGAIAYGCLFAYAGLYTYEFALRTVYLETWMESFAMILSLVGGQARFTIVLLFRSRFQRLLIICEELWAALNATEKKHVCDYVKTTRHLTYYYLFGCAFTIFFYAVASLFMGQHDDSSNATMRTLPYACPVEVHRSPYYEIMYIVQLCSMINVGLTCAGADTVGPVLVLTVCGHFKVLNTRILHLSDRDRVYSEKSCSTATHESHKITRENDIPKNRAKFNLKACVCYHQTMLDTKSVILHLFVGQLVMASGRSPYETRKPNRYCPNYTHSYCRCGSTKRKPVLCTSCTCQTSGRPCTELCRCDHNRCTNYEKKSDHINKVKEEMSIISNQKNKQEDIIEHMLNEIAQNNERIKKLEEKIKDNDVHGVMPGLR